MRLTAFTLVELMVVLVLSSILVGVCYHTLNLIFRDYNSFEKRGADAAELDMFYDLLAGDLQNAESAQYASEKLIFQNDSTVIEYIFNQDTVYRTLSGLTPHYKMVLPNRQTHLWFQEEQVHSGFFDRLEFVFLSSDAEPFSFSLYKQYSSVQKIAFENAIRNYISENE